MANEYEVDPQVLRQVEQGINAAMEELKELALDVHANMGYGFDDLKVSGLEVGHRELTEGFEEFCDRWGWGVRGLMEDANELARGLGLSAGLYHEQEQYASGILKQAWAAGVGNPYLSAEDAQNRSWSQTLKDNPVGHVMDADYSYESHQRSQEQAMQAWGQTWEDVKTSPFQDVAGAEARERSDWQWEGPPQAEQEDGGK